MKGLTLKFVWKYRMQLYSEGGKLRAEGSKLWAEGDKLRAEGSKLWAEGDKLRAEGDKLRAEGSKLYAEGDKLYSEGDKLRAEGDKLWAEGDKLWAEAILEVYGNIKLEWKNWDSEKQSYECHLENREVFKPSDVDETDDDSEALIAELEKRGRIKKGKIVS